MFECYKEKVKKVIVYNIYTARIKNSRFSAKFACKPVRNPTSKPI